jgi:hypothetical protein
MSNKFKILIVSVCFICAVIGFLVKLPSVFRHADKEMHALFYFFAAAFLNILFNIKNPLKHIAVFVLLLLFGIGIEYAQDYTNKIFHVHFHGRPDPEDVKANIKGLLIFSGVWVVWNSIAFTIKKKMDSADAKTV